MFTKTLTLSGLFVAFFIPFSSISAQDCTDATSTFFQTICGTQFTICVDDEKTDINTPVTISIFSNDNLGILQMCDVSISSPPSNGSVELVENCEMKYTPNFNYVGIDQFDFMFSYWDTCTEPYCEAGRHIWDMTSYYTGPDNVSLDVFAGNVKIGSEPLLNNGDIFTIDGTNLSNAENQQWTYRFYDNDCLNSGIHCKVLDFEDQDEGRIINNQYEGKGITISASNNNSSHPDLAIVFDSANPSLGNEDLGTPNEDFGGPGIGIGGKLGSQGVNDDAQGKLLIIAENSNGSELDGSVDDPVDEVAGGIITFAFERPVTVNNMKLVDLEAGGNDIIRCYNASGDLISIININGAGDNSVIAQIVNVADVSTMEVEFESSGAIDDISFCRPSICQITEVTVPTVCPASDDVFGKPQGGMFRPLSGCVAPTGAECASPVFRAPTEVSVLQTAETTVTILIEDAGLLPIEFGSIVGRAIDENNHIAWEVVDVIDERYMFLEKSNDGTSFEVISKFGDLRVGDYDAADNSVTSIITYYRIKSISNNGDLTYSRAIAVKNNKMKDSGIEIYPQPASTDLYFKSGQVIRSIELLDLSGRRVLFSMVNDAKYTLQLNDLEARGIYIAMILMDDGSKESRKVILK